MMDGGRTWDVVEVLLAGRARLAEHFVWCFRTFEAAGMVCREAEAWTLRPMGGTAVVVVKGRQGAWTGSLAWELGWARILFKTGVVAAGPCPRILVGRLPLVLVPKYTLLLRSY